MPGIDGKFALLKMAQTDLSVKRKKLTDNTELSEVEQLKAARKFAANANYLYAFN